MPDMNVGYGLVTHIDATATEGTNTPESGNFSLRSNPRPTKFHVLRPVRFLTCWFFRLPGSPLLDGRVLATVAVTGNRGLGSKERSRRANYPVLTH